MAESDPVAHVFVSRELPGDGLKRLRAVHDVDVWKGELPPPPDELRERLAGADALLAMLTDRIDEATLAGAPRLRAIANYAVGSDNVDLDAARARDIAVGVTPNVLTDATADLAWALILASARRLGEGERAVRAGDWRTWEPRGWLGLELHGATLGIIGRGRIGGAVAERAQGFAVSVVDAGRDRDEQRRVLEQADVVSLHCPLLAETHHLIDADALRRMKRSALLVNTARGPVVDTEALVAALHAGEIAAAALDVTDPEPLPADHPLLRVPGALVVPHIGSATHAARGRMTDCAVDNLLAALAGESMPYPAA